MVFSLAPPRFGPSPPYPLDSGGTVPEGTNDQDYDLTHDHSQPVNRTEIHFSLLQRLFVSIDRVSVTYNSDGTQTMNVTEPTGMLEGNLCPRQDITTLWPAKAGARAALPGGGTM